MSLVICTQFLKTQVVWEWNSFLSILELSKSHFLGGALELAQHQEAEAPGPACLLILARSILSCLAAFPEGLLFTTQA